MVGEQQVDLGQMLVILDNPSLLDHAPSADGYV
jgi:hypothetical protein